MQQLKTMPFFTATTASQLEQLERGCTEFQFGSADKLEFAQGQSDGYWFLLDGHWRVERYIHAVWHCMFDTDRIGTWTGGIPVIDAIAPVRASFAGPTKLVRIDVQAMHRLVAENPEVAKQLLGAVHWGSDHIGNLLN